MPAPTLLIGYNWVGGARVTASRLLASVNAATIQVSGPGKIPVRLLASVGAGAVDGEADLADLAVTISRPKRLVVDGLTTLAYAASVALDFDAGTDQRTIALTGNLTLTTSNRGVNKSLILRLVADGSTRTLTFPAGWVFVTDKPASIAAGKTGQLVLLAYGSADTDIIAAWAVQA
jgi:hypothetical protein